MTFLELCQTLRQEAGISGTGPSSVANQVGEYKKIVDWILRADECIQTVRQDWDFLWTEVEIEVPPNFKQILLEDFAADFNLVDEGGVSIYDITNQRFIDLCHVPFEQFRNLYRRKNVEADGVPKNFCITPDRKIEFDVAPKDGLELTFAYFRTPKAMFGNTDESLLPKQFHKAILYRALMFYAADEEASFIYQDAQQNYFAMLNRLEANQRQVSFTMPPPLA